jgi:formiminoglutamase
MSTGSPNSAATVRPPHCRPGVWPVNLSPTRLASRIRTDAPAGCRVALLGLADDLGVRLNGGRTGAAEGPTAIRAALARYGVAEPDDWTWPTIFDAGDVTPAPGTGPEALAQTHDRITDAAGWLLDQGLFPIGLGGGHDLTFAFVRAAAARFPGLAGVSFDAHLDVRPEPGSGMVYRALIERCKVARVDVFGLNPLVNSAEHVRWFESHGGRIRSGHLDENDAERNLPRLTKDFFVSFDLDVLDASHAPGVSAMNPAGWSTATATRMLLALAQSPRLRCLDLMELCPSQDPEGRTARVAAHMLLTALRGLHFRFMALDAPSKAPNKSRGEKDRP